MELGFYAVIKLSIYVIDLLITGYFICKDTILVVVLSSEYSSLTIWSIEVVYYLNIFCTSLAPACGIFCCVLTIDSLL